MRQMRYLGVLYAYFGHEGRRARPDRGAAADSGRGAEYLPEIPGTPRDIGRLPNPRLAANRAKRWRPPYLLVDAHGSIRTRRSPFRGFLATLPPAK